MSHLMYSTKDDTPVNRAALAAVPTPPGRGRFHAPYSFGTYVDDVDAALAANNIEIRREEYAVTNDHQRMFGVLEIGADPAVEGELITADEWKLLIGVRGSHDQSIARGLVLGSRVMVCSNLCFSGNIGNIHTRQTTNIGARLPGMIRDAVARVPGVAARQERVYDAYKNTELRPRGGDAALVEIYRRGGVSAAQLGRAIHEWHEPSIDEHAAEGWSAWRLMNSVTETLKPTGRHVNMETVARRTEVTSKFLDEVSKIDF